MKIKVCICKECAHCVVGQTYSCNSPAFIKIDYVTGATTRPLCNDIRTSSYCHSYVERDIDNTDW